MITSITRHINCRFDDINAKLAAFLLIVAALCSMAVAAVAVVESTPTRVVLAWELTGFDTASVDGGYGLETHVSFDGGYALTGSAGAPLIPGFSIHFGLPSSGTPRVTVQPEEMTAVRIANPLHRRDFPADPADPVFVSRWISEPAYEHVRGSRIGRVVLRPVVEAGPGRLQMLQRARIVIDIPAAPHTGASWPPRDDFERMSQRLLVNFNTAQGWQDRRSFRRAAEAPVPQEAFPFGIGQKLASFKVGDGSQDGNEGTTRENSLIRINGRRIIEIFGPNVPVNSVALYASAKGEMNDSVPRMGQIPSGVFEVPILRYDLNGNGTVDTSDYFIAYVCGASDWAYLEEGGQFSFSINRYDDYRTYWLTVKSGGEGLQMQNFTGPDIGSSSTLYETFVDNVYIRTPRTLNRRASEGGIDWAWKVFTLARNDTTIRLDLPGIAGNLPGSMRLINGLDTNMGDGGISHLAAFLGSNRLCESCRDAWVDIDSWESGELTLRYNQTALSSRALRELNAIHLRYPRSLNISGNDSKVEIFSSTTDGAVRYELTIDGGPAYIVRVPVDERSISLVGRIDGPSHTWSDNGNRGVRYMAMLESAIVDYSDSLEEFTHRPAASISYHIHNRDLRNTSNETDYLIITHEDFTDAAQKLAGHKANMGFNYPRIVELGDILTQFGGGNTDPAAIRNFLLYVYRYWQRGDAFSHVVLFGAGHYDYKHVTSRNVNFMPIPYIHHTLRRINDLSDDYYTFFDTLRHPSAQHDGYYYIGRLPAKSLAEASDIVDKIIEMEDTRFADFGPWRNRFLMVADDDQQGDRRDMSNHYVSTERISRAMVKDRPDIDLRKLYLFEYPWDDRYQKPGAARRFVNEINNGVAAMNFFGHGNPSQLTDERIFASADITALYNRRQYPVFTIFSCSVGKFDWPNMESMAELLVKQPRAGAVAVISAAREVFAGRNELLAIPFFEALFDPEESAGLSIGAALRYAKHRYAGTGSQDNRYYVILGDPSIRLYERTRNISLTITNADGNEIDTLKAMQQITIRGTVQDMQGLHDSNFGGGNAFVNITLFNPPQDTVLRKDGGTFTNPSPIYSLPGTPVFSASIPVVNGEFRQQLLLPMNLVFGRPGVKLTAYAWKTGDPATGTGIIDSLIFDGSEAYGIGDMTGPRISVRPVFTDANAAHMNQAGLFVRNRVTAQLPLTLEVNIESENGVNTIGTGPDEGLTAEISGALSKRSINHLFQFSPGSFRQGIATLTYDEKELKSGTHELIISAQDLIGNVSKLNVTLDIVDPSELKLDHVINVPNPVRMGRETRFFYHHSDNPGNLDVNVTIRIYSLGGRLLTVIRNPHNGYTWIPKDERGNLLTPNVYLYQVTASSPNIGRTVRSKVKKLVVHPPR